MNHTIPERKDTDPRFHWHIEDYFKTDADWEAAYVLSGGEPARADRLCRQAGRTPQKHAFPA